MNRSESSIQQLFLLPPIMFHPPKLRRLFSFKMIHFHDSKAVLAIDKTAEISSTASATHSNCYCRLARRSRNQNVNPISTPRFNTSISILCSDNRPSNPQSSARNRLQERDEFAMHTAEKAKNSPPLNGSTHFKYLT
jgi:hypothetical protein